MNWVETSLLGRIEKYLDLTALRQELVTGNMANVDTPHYRTLDFNFQRELQRAQSEVAPEALPPAVRQVTGLIERPDGNNVNMDREGLLLAQAQMQFRLGVQLIRSEFQRLATAIREGQ